MEKVALSVCRSYEREEIEKAVDRALDALGGLSAFIAPGQRVLIKPNLMRKSDPAQAAVTHPALLYAVARRCVALGAQVCVAESPGGAYNAQALRGIFQATGAAQAAADAGARVNDDFSEETVRIEGRFGTHELPVIAPALWADVIIDLPKLKSHTLAVYSGAVKNLYGLVPGFTKAELHFRYGDLEHFAGMIVDLCERFRPVLSIIDGVVAMEGEGPGSGDPRPLGAIVASASPHAADAAAAGLVGYEPGEIPTLRLAAEEGLFNGFSWAGDDPAAVCIGDFVRASESGNHLLKGRVPGPLQRPLENWLAPRPRVRGAACIGCGVCARTCPAHTIRISGGKARIRKSACIRCFCCQEFCPQKAITVRAHWAFRAVRSLTGEK